MYVARLSLTDFRSYPQADITLEPGVTVFVGPNGQGKTNLVEAIGYVATLDSHRAAADAPLVRLGAARAVLRTVVVRESRETLIEIEINPGKSNRARINRGAVPRAREVLGLLRTVLFAPEDLALVKGDPSERRRFLDQLLVARAPRFAGVRADYDRVVKQRNALLKSAGATVKSGRGDVATLDVWDAHLARTGSELLAARLDLVTAITPLVGKAYDAVAGGQGPTALEYKSSVPLPDRALPDPSPPGDHGEIASSPQSGPLPDREALGAALLAEMGRLRSTEIERGISLVGPHRDDLVLRLGPLPARGYASHGESWSFALALRLAAFELLRSESGSGGDPVLVLDDVFAELDAGRRVRLAELVADAEQVLVTAAVPEDVPAALAGTRVEVRPGELRP